jgi:hypothetical protein
LWYYSWQARELPEVEMEAGSCTEYGVENHLMDAVARCFKILEKRV